jgi:hypothetical protein
MGIFSNNTAELNVMARAIESLVKQVEDLTAKVASMELVPVAKAAPAKPEHVEIGAYTADVKPKLLMDFSAGVGAASRLFSVRKGMSNPDTWTVDGRTVMSVYQLFTQFVDPQYKTRKIAFSNFIKAAQAVSVTPSLGVVTKNHMLQHDKGFAKIDKRGRFESSFVYSDKIEALISLACGPVKARDAIAAMNHEVASVMSEHDTDASDSQLKAIKHALTEASLTAVASRAGVASDYLELVVAGKATPSQFEARVILEAARTSKRIAKAMTNTRVKRPTFRVVG